MKRNRRRQALPSLMISCMVTAFLLGLSLSTLICPPFCSSTKLLLFVSLRNKAASVLKPEYLFIVCNLIVVFLVVDSKLLGSSSPPDIYEEYMIGNTSLRRRSRSQRHRGSSLEKALLEEEEEKRGGGWEETEIRWETPLSPFCPFPCFLIWIMKSPNRSRSRKSSHGFPNRIWNRNRNPGRGRKSSHCSLLFIALSSSFSSDPKVFLFVCVPSFEVVARMGSLQAAEMNEDEYAKLIRMMNSASSVGILPSKSYTLLELTGTDRPGLLSEVCAVLNDLNCNVVKAEVWTHNTRTAAVVQVTDKSSHGAIEDPYHLSRIKELLFNVLKGDSDSSTAKMTVSVGLTHAERRLHQLMLDERDYDEHSVVAAEELKKKSRTQVTVLDCADRDYTVVTVRSKDRPKLLFDTLCALTDMQYSVYHGTVDAGDSEAYQIEL
ncbi:hypothetical protein GW17_00048466 [Ensete ventricosum]|nr:hypothetical protein GW17_00048466 [Ensete ventricosum]